METNFGAISLLANIIINRFIVVPQSKSKNISMKVSNQVLIEDLTKRTKEHIAKAKGYLQLDIKKLNQKKTPEKWSLLECIEHLNRYGDFYIPEIKQRIQTGKKATETAMFKSGWLGNYFAESMLPKEKLNKMKTFKSMNPAGSQLGVEVLEKFIKQQEELLDLLEKAKTIDLAKTKTAISISKWIKLRLGDTFRVVIYHNYRHILQSDNAIK